MFVETFTTANVEYYPATNDQDAVICENMCRARKF